MTRGANAENGSTHPAYGRPRPVTALATVVLADNPSPMTLEGTNTWVLRAAGSPRSIVIDPGPDDATHLQAVLDVAQDVTTILLTHGHPDHSDGARRLHELTGAAVQALDPGFQLGNEGLADGDVIAEAGVELRVWATPGHSSDSLSFLLSGPGEAGPGETTTAVLTGDTILGRGTTVVAYPDGDLGDYLASLHRLRELGDAMVLPGHGPELDRAGAAAEAYLAHREQRLEQVRAVVAELGPHAVPRAVVERVYTDVDPVLWPAADLSVAAQLAYLRGENRGA